MVGIGLDSVRPEQAEDRDPFRLRLLFAGAGNRIFLLSAKSKIGTNVHQFLSVRSLDVKLKGTG